MEGLEDDIWYVWSLWAKFGCGKLAMLTMAKFDPAKNDLPESSRRAYRQPQPYLPT